MAQQNESGGLFECGFEMNPGVPGFSFGTKWNQPRWGWWPGTELNRRRQHFQGCALPTELPGRGSTSVSTRVRLLQCHQHFAGLPLDVGMQAVPVRVHGHDGGEVLDAEAPRAFDEPLLRLIRKKRPPFAPKLLCC